MNSQSNFMQFQQMQQQLYIQTQLHCSSLFQLLFPNLAPYFMELKQNEHLLKDNSITVKMEDEKEQPPTTTLYVNRYCSIIDQRNTEENSSQKQTKDSKYHSATQMAIKPQVDQPQKQILIKKIHKGKRRKHTRKSYNQGHWTKKEHKLYLQFVEIHSEVMQKSDLKKQEKIFKQMSLIIKTRSPSQCRSHHQKFDPLNQKISELVCSLSSQVSDKIIE